MSFGYLRTAVFFAGLAIALPSSAGVIYNEATEGDASDDFEAPTSLAPQSASFTVTGSGFYSVLEQDLDIFSVVVQEGATITDIEFDIGLSQITDPMDDLAAFIAALDVSGSSGGGTIQEQLFGTPIFDGETTQDGLSGQLPLEAGFYLFGVRWAFADAETSLEGIELAYDYSVTFAVQQPSDIPVPAPLALLGLGLVGLGAVRRRKAA